jgi:hypothetical protein
VRGSRRGGTRLRLCCAEMPPGPGKRLAVLVPAGHELAAQLAPGTGVTLSFAGDVWRSTVTSAEADGEGCAVELQITGRYAG